jgi:uncharacterized membrane protein YeaQ/YmgE (transglycosylase-associated protein family)
MNFIVWVLFGALAGWIASMIMGTDYRQGFLMDVALGIVGAVIGGWLMETLGQPGVTGFNLYSMGVAIVGASLLILGGRLLRRA